MWRLCLLLNYGVYAAEAVMRDELVEPWFRAGEVDSVAKTRQARACWEPRLLVVNFPRMCVEHERTKGFFVDAVDTLSDPNASSTPTSRCLIQVVKCDGQSPSPRNNSPNWPVSVHRSASFKTRSLYAVSNRFRLASRILL